MSPLHIKGKDDKEKKITFFSKEAVRCPVCGSAFHREELFSGRVNAGDLTDELHRKYIPMRNFGEVHPLVYDVTVCPSCFYASFRSDFSAVPQKILSALAGGEETDYGDTYFMTQPRLETGDPRYEWVNRTVAVAEGRRPCG